MSDPQGLRYFLSPTQAGTYLYLKLMDQEHWVSFTGGGVSLEAFRWYDLTYEVSVSNAAALGCGDASKLFCALAQPDLKVPAAMPVQPTSTCDDVPPPSKLGQC